MRWYGTVVRVVTLAVIGALTMGACVSAPPERVSAPRERPRLVCASAAPATPAPTPGRRPPRSTPLDVNRDGFADLPVVWATRVTGGGVRERTIIVLTGGRCGLDPGRRVVLDRSAVAGVARETGFGRVEGIRLMVADFDGDGQADLAAWESGGKGAGGKRVGSITIYFGGPAAGKASVDLPGIAQTGEAGLPVVAGDFNGDGRLDLLAHDALGRTRGAGVWYGTARGIDLGAGPADSYPPGMRGPQSGATGMAAIADVNGDGFDDIVRLFRRPDPERGRATRGILAVYGSRSGLNTSSPQTIERVFSGLSRKMRWPLGQPTVGGDFNGDGFADFAIVSPGIKTRPPAVVMVMGGRSGLIADSLHRFTL